MNEKRPFFNLLQKPRRLSQRENEEIIKGISFKPIMNNTSWESIGELRVTNFTCSEHGRIKPVPRCPECAEEAYKQGKEEGIREGQERAVNYLKEQARYYNTSIQAEFMAKEEHGARSLNQEPSI